LNWPKDGVISPVVGVPVEETRLQITECRMRNRIAAGAVTVLTALALAGCSGAPPVEVVESRQAMDAAVSVRAVAPTEAAARRALEAAWKEMDECVLRLDGHRGPTEAWLKGDPAARKDPLHQPSDVWRINADAGKFAAVVDPMVTSCLAAAREVYDLSGGAFDPTVGPLIALWRDAAGENRMPTDAEIEKARSLVGMNKIEMLIAEAPPSPDEPPPSLPGSPPGAAGAPVLNMVGLGGIARGFIIGRMAERMKRAGATAGLIAVAGRLYAFGERPRGADGRKSAGPWTVDVPDPRYPEDKTHIYTAVRLRNQAIATIGCSDRADTIEGRRFSSIVDPHTGRPVDTRLASITVVADDPAVADAVATAIAVMGVEKGLAMVEEAVGVECLFLEGPPDAPLRADGAPAPDAPLIAHRSKGFAALEVKPGE